MRTIELTWDEQSSSNYFIRESFNTLRANILFSGKGVKVIVVTSCFAHEGKSSVSFDLCRNLAESGKRVLLVDADLRKSAMLTRYTKERGVYGLSQILSGQVEAAAAIYSTNVENFDLVFSGPYPPNPTELVGSPAFKEFVDGVRGQYDYVIVDAPPLGLVIDAAVMSSACDGAVMVINIGHVKYRMAQSVKMQLEKSGCKVLGVVLNQVDRKRSLKAENTYYSAYLASEKAAERASKPVMATPTARPTQSAPAARPAQSAPATAARPAPSATVRPVSNARPASAPAPVARPQPTAPTQPTVPVRPIAQQTQTVARPVQPTPAARPVQPTPTVRPYGTVPPITKKED